MAEIEHHSVSHNRRVGLWLFAIYVAVYAGFVGLVAADFGATETVVFMGLNLATVYGFGLIGGAFAIALAYLVLAKPESAEAAK